METLIVGKWLLPMTPEAPLLRDHAILLKGARIEAIGPYESLRQHVDPAHVLPYPNHVIMPGWINAHAHTPMVLLRGLGDDCLLDTWLQKHIWPAEKALLSPEFIYDGMILGMAEMLRHGITTFSEHYFLPETATQAVYDFGMRALIGLFLGDITTSFAQGLDAWFEKAKEMLQQPDPSDTQRVQYCYAPHSTYLMPDEGLRALKKLHQQYPRRIHIHLNETAQDIAAHIAQHGNTPIERLHQFGLLNNDLIAVHMVHHTPQDLALLKQSGCHIVTCPDANLKLGSGMCDLKMYQDMALNIAIGTDGAASNNDLDILSEAKLAGMLAKGMHQDPTVFPAMDILKMLTIQGAKCLGMATDIGSLEVGKQADILAIDMQHLNSYPQHHPASQIVYALNSHQVSDVWIAGRQRLKQGMLCDYDMQTLCDIAQRWSEKTKSFSH